MSMLNLEDGFERLLKPAVRLLISAIFAAGPWIGLPIHGQQPEPAQVLLQPCDACVPGVINFAKVSDALWRGAQPTAEGFKALEKMGAKTVVSFRHENDDLSLLKGTQLKYLRIPSYAFHPTRKHLAKFLKVLEDPANWPVFIHCAQGRDRTGYNAAAYRMVFQGWRAEEAITEMNTFHFNRVWVGNPGFLMKLDVQEMKQKLLMEPVPEFLTGQP
jgi:protein tyrosine phosphatase (PTP) superfamily phosphohydrolase (DUF442 family)